MPTQSPPSNAAISAARDFCAAGGYGLASAGRNAVWQPSTGKSTWGSDTDVAVLLQGAAGDFVATKLALVDVADEVLLDSGIRIQPLPIWECEWAHPEQYSNPRLLENIAREGFAL